MAKRSIFTRIKGFAFGRGRRRTRYHSGPNGSEASYKAQVGYRGRAGRLRAAKEHIRENRYETGVYTKKALRGGWGYGYELTKTGRYKRRNGQPVPRKPKIRLTEEERKEEARIASRRRYHAKHPGAKYRNPRDYSAGGKTQPFLAAYGHVGRYATRARDSRYG